MAKKIISTTVITTMPRGGGQNCLWLSYSQSTGFSLKSIATTNDNYDSYLPYRNSSRWKIYRRHHLSSCCDVEQDACSTLYTSLERCSADLDWTGKSRRSLFVHSAPSLESSSLPSRLLSGDLELSSPAPFALSLAFLNIRFDCYRTKMGESMLRNKFWVWLYLVKYSKQNQALSPLLPVTFQCRFRAFEFEIEINLHNLLVILFRASFCCTVFNSTSSNLSL